MGCNQAPIMIWCFTSLSTLSHTCIKMMGKIELNQFINTIEFFFSVNCIFPYFIRVCEGNHIIMKITLTHPGMYFKIV